METHHHNWLFVFSAFQYFDQTRSSGRARTASRTAERSASHYGQMSQSLGPNSGLRVLLPSQLYIVGCFRRNRSAVPVAAVSSEPIYPSYLLRSPEIRA